MKHLPIVRDARLPCHATLDFDEAQAILAAIARPLGVERVQLAKAGRRVLAEPVYAATDIPRRDLAAMDGFAICAAELDAGRRRFAVKGASYPGAGWSGPVHSGEAIRIMTGAAMPDGTDQVLMRELVSENGDIVTLGGSLPAKRHVRRRGSDARAGAEMLPAGKVIDPRALVVAAAADADELVVWRQPGVHVIATGDELAPSGQAHEDGAVPDSLSEALLLMARQWGAKPLGAGLVRDDPSLLAAAVEQVLPATELIVLCGGASRGDRDFAKTALAPLGLEIAFADVAIKPGKPVWLGRIGTRLILGLPGNPTAAMTVARLFLAPLLSGLGGRGVTAGLRWERRPLHEEHPRTGDREAFLCGERLDQGVRVLPRQAASDQYMLGRADLLVRVRPGAEALSIGGFVEVLRF